MATRNNVWRSLNSPLVSCSANSAAKSVRDKYYTYNFSVAEIQSVPHKALRQRIWLLSNVFFVCFYGPMTRHHLIWEKKTKHIFCYSQLLYCQHIQVAWTNPEPSPKLRMFLNQVKLQIWNLCLPLLAVTDTYIVNIMNEWSDQNGTWR